MNKTNSGFTLIEMLISIVIMSMLALGLLALLKFTNWKEVEVREKIAVAKILKMTNAMSKLISV